MTLFPSCRSRLRDDRGAALATVALLGSALVLIAAVIVVRQMVEFDAGSTDRTWEEALHVAESGADDVFYGLTQDEQYLENTDRVVDATTTIDIREDAISEASDLARDFPDTVVTTPDGDVVVFQVEGVDVLYAVAFSPSIDATRRVERVIAIEYQRMHSGNPWTPQGAILSEEDIQVSANAQILGSHGNVHSNKAANVHQDAVITGCASGYDPQSARGSGPDCTLPVELVFMPQVDPLRTHYLSQYDVCTANHSFHSRPSGVYAGPANTDPTATPAEPGVPCSGSFVDANRGIAGIGTGSVHFDLPVPDGVYYVDGLDASIRAKKDVIKNWSIIVGTEDGALDCSTSGGNVYITGQGEIRSNDAAANYAVVAGGDLRIESQLKFRGLLATHEAVRYAGGATIVGSVVAEGACDHPASPLRGNETQGNSTVIYNGNLASDFILKDWLGVAVVDREEIRAREL